MTERGESGQGAARPGESGHGEARVRRASGTHPGSSLGRPRRAGCGLARRGKAWRGVAWHGPARQGKAPQGKGGPRDAVKLWDDENFRHMASVKVGTSRTMRCRPQFRDWRVAAEGVLDTNILEPSDLESIAETAGNLIGLGDWRPRYGRFVAEVKPR